MGDRTNIAWADGTVNYWWGCTRVSPGCAHCYAADLAGRLRGIRYVKGEPRVQIDGAYGIANKIARRARADGRRLRVFTNSMSDFFDPEVPPGWRAGAWATIRRLPELDWLILTKRPELIHDMLPDGWGGGWPHVWLGTSVESDAQAWRIARLLAVPAAIHFLSLEPLLGLIALPPFAPFIGVDWVILGGESGRERRQMELIWLTDLAHLLINAGVPVFVKQDSALKPGTQGRIPDDVWALKQMPPSDPRTSDALL
jgi:protein gp37